MSNHPTLSVVITTYNRRQLLSRAVTSAISQLGQFDELIIVDDHSTDTTSQMVKPWLKDKRIHYLKHRRNRGVQNSRNTGIAFASKAWISFLDSDDQFLPGSINTIRKQIRRYQDNYDIIQFMLTSNLKRDSGPLIGYLPRKRWLTYQPTLADIVLKTHFIGDMHRCVKTTIAKANLWAKNNPGNETYHYSKLAKQGIKFIYINKTVVQVDESQDISHSSTRHTLYTAQHILLYQKFLNEHQSIFATNKRRKSDYQRLIGRCYKHQGNLAQCVSWYLKGIVTNPLFWIYSQP